MHFSFPSLNKTETVKPKKSSTQIYFLGFLSTFLNYSFISTGESVEQPTHRSLLVLGVEGRDELALGRTDVRPRHGGLPLSCAGTLENPRTSGNVYFQLQI